MDDCSTCPRCHRDVGMAHFLAIGQKGGKCHPAYPCHHHPANKQPAWSCFPTVQQVSVGAVGWGEFVIGEDRWDWAEFALRGSTADWAAAEVFRGSALVTLDIFLF